MRVFRWTRDFHVHKESSLAPVWFSLPALPIHYFDNHSLFSIVSPVGNPLFLDSAMAAVSRPSVARVCVEVDLLKPLCTRVWVAVEGEAGFWQQFVPEGLSSYCSTCRRMGHSVEECRRNAVEQPGPQFQRRDGRVWGSLKLGTKVEGLPVTETRAIGEVPGSSAGARTACMESLIGLAAEETSGGEDKSTEVGE
ncbi:uncharacterized protein LOC113758825 [Coffea eugenioides]|uniref:uncharacterized protein LOC113758825 n=1 Tax=Coffea eugenioides TaxID=49369 RepID=UPI000F60979B|nr:uncharacterized protein LOC113758825 [Coffea eugenioides]